jgi:hypothetical protein
MKPLFILPLYTVLLATHMRPGQANELQEIPSPLADTKHTEAEPATDPTAPVAEMPPPAAQDPVADNSGAAPAPPNVGDGQTSPSTTTTTTTTTAHAPDSTEMASGGQVSPTKEAPPVPQEPSECVPDTTPQTTTTSQVKPAKPTGQGGSGMVVLSGPLEFGLTWRRCTA